jgi:hypothetical protein
VEGVDAGELREHICAAFPGVRAVDSSGDTFLLYDPDGDLLPDRQFPIATIVTGDHYDSVSGLDRPGAYRLNIRLPKDVYDTRFGDVQAVRGTDGILDTGFDYAARDTLMPHPVYAVQHWVCVVNPADASLATVWELLAEAHALEARKHAARSRFEPPPTATG